MYIYENNKASSLTKREVKRRKIITATVQLMNEEGVSNVTLNDAAKAAGLSRNGVYHYFRSHVDLVYACYHQAVTTQSGDLMEAINLDGDVAGKICFFVEKALSTDTQEQVVMSNLQLLPEPQQTEIRTAQAENCNILKSLIQQGIDAGMFRATDTEVAAQVLIGLISWAQLWHKWAGLQTTKTGDYHAVAATVIIDLFLNGISAHRDLKFKCLVTAEKLSSRGFNIFDSDSLNEEKRRQLLDSASLLFNQRGLDATSLNDIADYIGATKGTLYHYFIDKQALVNDCYHNAFALYEVLARAANKAGNTGCERLLMVLHLNCQAQMSLRPPMILQVGISALSSSYLQRALKLAHNLHRLRLAAVVDGSGRKMKKAAPDLSPGLTFWIPKWRSENPTRDSVKLADTVCDLVANGLLL